MTTVFGMTTLGAFAAIVIGSVFPPLAEGRPRRGGPPRETNAAPTGGAFPEDQACLTAFRAAEASEQAGRLRSAKERLFLCAQPLCARAIRRQCAVRYAQIDADIPSVVPVVQDQLGTPLSDVQVAVDGEPLSSHLDGRALAVDPGLHRFTFSRDGQVISRQEVMIVQGQRNRLLPVSWSAPERSSAVAARGVVAASTRSLSGKLEQSSLEVPGRFPPPGPASTTVSVRATAAPGIAAGSTATARAAQTSGTDGDAAPPRRARARRVHRLASDHTDAGASVPAAPANPKLLAATADEDASRPSRGPGKLVLALGGLGLASTVAGLLLTYWGRTDNAQLSQCSPLCSESAVSHVRKMYIAGDIALGVGIAALGGATWALFRNGPPTAPRPVDTAYRLEVRPSAGGALALVRGIF